MSKKHLAIEAILLVLVIGLAGTVWSQSSRMSELDDQTQKLQARLEHLEASPRPDRPRERSRTSDGERVDEQVGVEVFDDGASPESSDTERRMWRDRAAETLEDDGPLDIDDPEVRMKLRKVVAEEQQFLRDERRARRQEHREERIREQVKAMARSAGLDDATAVKVEDMLVVELAEVSDIFRKAREDGNWREMRDKIGQIREQTDREAAELLQGSELAEYQKMREEEMNRWGRRGRDRDRDQDDEEKNSGSSK